MKHTMLDIETLASKATNPVLLAIGAVRFDGKEILDRFHVGIDPADCQRYGLVVEADTVMWWLDPKRDQARKELLEMGRIDLYAALDGFRMWLDEVPVDERGSLWGKGATFDNVRLKSAYEAIRLDYPVSYKQDECYRTLANRCADVKFEMIGTAHVAVADAESQAVHLQRICEQYGIPL